MNPSSKTILKLHNFHASLDGIVRLENACATFDSEHPHAVVGRSGAGKSVLLKCALGLLPLTQGYSELILNNTPFLKASANLEHSFIELRKKAVLVLQDPALLDDLTIAENLDFVLSRVQNPLPYEKHSFHSTKRTIRTKRLEYIHHWLSHMNLNDVSEMYPAQLSPGLQRKVALTRALCLQPTVLIADEPTTGLDPSAARSIDESLQKLSQEGVTLIVITHDLRSIKMLQPKLTWVHHKRVPFSGFLDDEKFPLELQKILQL